MSAQPPIVIARGVRKTYETGRLLRALDVEHTAEHLRLVADDTDAVSVDAGKATDGKLPFWPA